MADDAYTLEIAKTLYDYILQDIADGDRASQSVSRIQVTLNELLDAKSKNATFADWSDPEHIKARLRVYEDISREDEFAFFPKVIRALHVLADDFTRDDDLTGFTVSPSRNGYYHSDHEYIESWRVLRKAIGRQVKGTHE